MVVKALDGFALDHKIHVGLELPFHGGGSKAFARRRAAASSPAATTTQLPFRSRRTNSVIYSPTQCYANGTEAMSIVNTSPGFAVNVREERLFSRQRR